MIGWSKQTRELLEALNIDPDTALCPAVTDSNGVGVRCQKRFDGHTAHLGRVGSYEVVW
jgi:hypothetical protein